MGQVWGDVSMLFNVFSVLLHCFFYAFQCFFNALSMLFNAFPMLFQCFCNAFSMLLIAFSMLFNAFSMLFHVLPERRAKAGTRWLAARQRCTTEFYNGSRAACPLTPGARGEPQRRGAILRCVPAPERRAHAWRASVPTDTGGASRRAPVRTVSETCPNPSGTLFEHRRARTAS